MKIRIMPYGTVNFIQHEVPYAVRAVSEIMGYSTYRVFFSKRFPTLPASDLTKSRENNKSRASNIAFTIRR